MPDKVSTPAGKQSQRRQHRRQAPVTVHDGDIVDRKDGLVLHIKTFSKEFDFSGWVNVFGRIAARKIAYASATFYLRYTKSTVANRHALVTKFLSHCKQIEPQGVSKNSKKTFSNLEKVTWQRLIDHFTITQRKHLAPSSYGEVVKMLNVYLEELGSCGLVPAFKPVQVPKGARKSVKHYLPIAAAVQAKPSDVSDELQETAEERRHASRELRRHTESLATFRETLEAEFLKGMAQIELGEQRLQRARSDIVEQYCHALTLASRPRTRALEALFPESDVEQSASNLLVLFRDYFGQFPTQHELNSPTLKAIQKLGVQELKSQLTLGVRPLVAALAMLQEETGVNPSYGLSLECDYEQPTDDKNIVLITSVKLRVNLEPIDFELRINDGVHQVSVASALRQVLKCNQALRTGALANKLFVYNGWHGIAEVSAQQYALILPKISKDAGLGRVLPSNVRPSTVLRAIAAPHADAHTARQRLRHATNSTSSFGYVAAAAPVFESRMRDFQEMYQVGLAGNVPGALESLNYSKDQIKTLKAAAERTGLGLYCVGVDRTDKPQNPDGSCAALGTCSQCPAKLFVADPFSIAEQIAIHELLTTRMNELETDDPIRWQSTWTPMLALSTVILQRVKTSHYARHLRNARRLASEMLSIGYDPTLLRP